MNKKQYNKWNTQGQRLYDYVMQSDTAVLIAPDSVTSKKERDEVLKHNVAFICACFVTESKINADIKIAP